MLFRRFSCMTCRRSAARVHGIKAARLPVPDSDPFDIRGEDDSRGCEKLSRGWTCPRVPVVYHPAYSAPRLKGPGGTEHRFPMQVFGVIFRQLVESGIAGPGSVFVPDMLPSRQLLHLAHGRDYVDDLLTGRVSPDVTRRIGFYDAVNTPLLIERSLSEVAGTLLTARLALTYGLACNTAGGTHHAHRDSGSGFCVVNDLAIATRALQATGEASRIAVLDLDVHQGDGTAGLLGGDESVLTISVHAASNFPARKMRSHIDIALADGTDDDGFMEATTRALESLRSFEPDLVLYDAGVDIHQADALGRLSVTDSGIQRREMLVLDTCLAHGIPVACYVGGGYDKDLEILAARHTMLHEAAQECFEGYALGAMVSHDSLPFIPMPIASMDDIPGWDSCDKYGRIEGT